MAGAVKYRHDDLRWWQDDPLCEDSDADAYDWVDPSPNPEQSLLAAEALLSVRWHYNRSKQIAELAQEIIQPHQLWQYIGSDQSLAGWWLVADVEAMGENRLRCPLPERWDRYPDVRLFGVTTANWRSFVTVRHQELLSGSWRRSGDRREDVERRAALVATRPSFLRMWDRSHEFERIEPEQAE